jgi:hypothetical protein
MLSICVYLNALWTDEPTDVKENKRRDEVRTAKWFVGGVIPAMLRLRRPFS